MPKRRWLVITVGIVLAAAAVFAAEQVVLWRGTRSPAEEAERLGELTRIRPGQTVAEIGAGRGEMARSVGAQVLPGGRLFVTELEDDRLSDLRAIVAGQQWDHVEVRRGEAAATALPDRCCDLIYMRHVFHHFEDPAVMARALRRAVSPGGRLAVIDFEPQWFLNLVAPIAPGRGHGVTADTAIRHLTDAGFTLQHHDPRWTAGTFLVLLRAAE